MTFPPYPLCPCNGSISRCPLRLSASKSPTITSQDTPGKKESHHRPLDKYRVDSDNMIPIDGVSVDNPKPRKVMEASCKIACGNSKINPTISCGNMWGKK